VVLRLAVAALLVFSFVRVPAPLTTRSARAQQIVCHVNLTRTAVVESGARSPEITQSSTFRLVESLASIIPTPTAFLISRPNLFRQIWPEHWRAFFRRIPPSTFDDAH
jgi:hypothetical protein